MHPLTEYQLNQTRRQFFGATGLRLGGLAAAMLAGRGARAADANPAERVHPPLPGFPNFPPKARAVIYLHTNGGPSQLDTFDYKPKLVDRFNEDLPESVRKGQRITTMTSGQGRLPVAPSVFKFAQHGTCGTWVSELLPHTAKFADDLAVVKTVHTNAINHDPACTFVMTGSEVPGKPSIGSWLSYGLGSESNDLPAFVVFTPYWSSGAAAQALFSRMWGSGFLPGRFSGVALRSVGDPVLYVQNPDGVGGANRRVMLDALGELNRKTFDQYGDPETLTRIAQYEMAFRMQTSVPDLTDLSKEPEKVLESYGPEVRKPGSFAASALMARRLVERGVRVVQILHRGWDQHGNLPNEIRSQCRDTDQPTAALLADLKRKGLLDSTLVVWGGEFGRTVYSQGTLTKTNYGRDHHPRNFCMWLAGGGIRGGQVYGETDDFSYNVAENPAHVNDLNATVLHCLGVDHAKFSFKFQGLDQRLTGVEEQHVIKALLK
ncbi:protein containing duf1501 : Uncharacterized protein OS=Chthoniobacter flavus Ellin428 GN=CfE428DRAFT_4090 PE=4 SV=1: DUF1501 [Gemmataceae bacterium]|nr:protein containing duf1501 : Uncharacterized protein OS=Chthoniobacter flavus Ellin428 GN=CfE428DRAFT_4090 PE=4 SV=1: DUF1501 [Gemmataceae bacterium]VTT98437.1 protein containing duf1501 : Uncharacterized protein OS=Chthoniobacter flavus Ellin428 GN=CfE428DRAFT_4090 PE=4 SV=1: DUF1501 [Gemmataceae bacterium]